MASWTASANEVCRARSTQQALDVHVGHDQLALPAEALPLGEENAVLGDQQVAAEDEVGRGLVDAGVGEDVGGEGAAGLLAHELPAVLGLGHEVVRGRGVQDDGGARDRVARAGRDRGPEVLADLDREGDPGVLRQPEEEVRAEGGRLAGQAHLALARLARRREPAFLVVLLVAGEEGLRHHPQDPARLEDRRGVEEAAALQHGEPHGHHDGAPGRVAQDPLEGPLGTAHEGGQAEEEVPAGVAGQPQLGEHDHLGPAFSRPGHEVERGVGVPLRVGHRDGRARRRHPQEAEGRCSHEQILTPGGLRRAGGLDGPGLW